MSDVPVSSRVLIIGAGFAGRSLAKEIYERFPQKAVVVFLDDDPGKIGGFIDHCPIDGPIQEAALRWAPEVDEAILAIPSATKGQLRAIYQHLRRARIPKIRILPALSQVVDGDAHLVLTRDIDPQDLLGRNPVQISLRKSLGYLRGKRVLITGAGGSIGSELARQLLSGGAERLYLFGHGENSIYHIDRELRELQAGGVGEKAVIVPVIGELKDKAYVDFILRRLKADVIFHCAAYKHVPLMEHNPVEAVFNNILGTLNLLEAAQAAGTPRFVLVSTDKAVAPPSVYGATKRVCEDLVLAQAPAATEAGPAFMVVRFGNVLGSRGSIVPLFKEQIAAGGPLTITDPAAKRYFMTIPEAASLVLQTGGVGQSGQLYLLDMGEPVLIEDLARQMLAFYGRRAGDDIPIRYIGLRPGEKTEEFLWEDTEEPVPTPYARINRLIRPQPRAAELTRLIDALRPICHFDPAQPEAYRNRRRLRAALRAYLPSVQDQPDEPEY